ncbi:MAG: uracil-DNA glycosylase [Candidatus Latescibacteria bacterium]|jgi:DNA polymerase|nr:uracil-DNA glycosylase [Candidatus Latescibacterota bacterium]
MTEQTPREATAFIAQQIALGDDLWPSPEPPKVDRDVAAPPPKNDQPKPAATADMVSDSMTADSPPVSQARNSWDGLTLDGFQKAVCECQTCPLGATRTMFVFGQGDPNADLMFIGEAPGKDEDEQGLAFVGRAGQLLTKMIDAMGLSRDTVFIANVLKCRPPSNRDPAPHEVEMCEPYLKHQIELIKPKIICALGRIAAQTLLQSNESLGKLRQQTHTYEGIALWATYHPAYLLRDPRQKRPAWDDLKRIRFALDGTTLQ